MAITSTSDFSGTALLPPVRLEHPLYATWRPVWEKCIWVVEGSGPFLDGTALWAHPREWEDYTSDTPTKPTKKLKSRRAMARYENVANLLIKQTAGALFRVGPQRLAGPQDAAQQHPLALWWDDVDGSGTPMSAYLKQAWHAAATFGHVFLLMDRDEDDASRLYLRTYTPIDAPDWVLNDEGTLTGIKFVEPAKE